MLDTAKSFFEACETGKGWAACAEFCEPSASFSCQSGALADTTTLEAYTEWMKGILVPLPDGHYELTSFSADEERATVTATAVFHGTHTVDGPVPATHKATATDYAYVIKFNGSKVSHMTKIWNDGFALKELGWA